MRFWGKDRKQDNRKNIWIEHLNIDTGNWFQVFSACLGKMIAIQTACSEQVVKGQDWNVDFSEGVILFGNQKYPLQFIGSEATSSNTWLWGWENVNGFSEKIIQVATHAKVVGERWNLEPLTTAEFTLDDMLALSPTPTECECSIFLLNCETNSFVTFLSLFQPTPLLHP